jgi:hypothetical protein
VHVHHVTDEVSTFSPGPSAIYSTTSGSTLPRGRHVLLPRGTPHTFWNAGDETASCLIVLTPPGFEAYFGELARGLAESESEDAAMEVRKRLSARFDIEVVGPPVGLR